MDLQALPLPRSLPSVAGARAEDAVPGAGDEERRLELLLRAGVALCFVGHGAFGILTKSAWLPYFALVGIGPETAYRLMPLIGTVDVAMGLLALFAPCRAVLLYTALWALGTALLRPLAGEGAWEAMERAGNYGVPLALLLAAAPVGEGRAWTGRLRVPALGPDRRRLVLDVLRWTTVLLLVGHGGIALFERKASLAAHWAVLGLPDGVVPAAGALEIGLGALVLLRPSPGLFLLAFGWKVGTELLFPLSGAPVWELVERGGSFAAPLAAALLRAGEAPRRDAGREGARPVARTAALAAVLLAAGAAPAAAQGAPPGLLAELRRGGFVLACRHAITDHETPDPESGQRVLSAEGREQARRLGEAVRRLGVPVGPVLTSPLLRTLVSARLSFGEVEPDPALTSQGEEADRRRLFQDPVPSGGNRVLMTHQGILRGMLPSYGRAPIEEGDCLVLRPGGSGESRVVARVGADGWARLR